MLSQCHGNCLVDVSEYIRFGSLLILYHVCVKLFYFIVILVYLCNAVLVGAGNSRGGGGDCTCCPHPIVREYKSAGVIVIFFVLCLFFFIGIGVSRVTNLRALWKEKKFTTEGPMRRILLYSRNMCFCVVFFFGADPLSSFPSSVDKYRTRCTLFFLLLEFGYRAFVLFGFGCHNQRGPQTPALLWTDLGML